MNPMQLPTFLSQSLEYEARACAASVVRGYLLIRHVQVDRTNGARLTRIRMEFIGLLLLPQAPAKTAPGLASLID